MKTFILDTKHPSSKQLGEIARMVMDGAVIVYPTDTIYGVGCGVYARDAIKRIYSIKERNRSKPFSFICENVAQISRFAFVPNMAYSIMKRCLPGPYTFILQARKTNLPKKMLGKRNTVGVRIPDNPVCAKLAELTGHPLVSTSLNMAGEEPLADPRDAPEKFPGRIDAVIFTGLLVSEPSTVIDLSGAEPEIIRQGKGTAPW